MDPGCPQTTTAPSPRAPEQPTGPKGVEKLSQTKGTGQVDNQPIRNNEPSALLIKIAQRTTIKNTHDQLGSTVRRYSCKYYFEVSKLTHDVYRLHGEERFGAMTTTVRLMRVAYQKSKQRKTAICACGLRCKQIRR